MLLKFSLSSLKFSLSSLSTLITIFWNSVFDKLLASVSFTSFSGDFCSFTWGVSLCLPICGFVSHCIVGKYVMFPSPGRVASCSRCPVGPRDTVSLITCAGYSRKVSCVGCVSPPVVIESWLLLAHSCLRLSLKLADREDWPRPYCTSCCAGRYWPHKVELASADSGACWGLPLDMLLVNLSSTWERWCL